MAAFCTDKPYNIRPGTTTDLGHEYEYNMIALLSARSIARNMEEMSIATNLKGVGAFDDIILHIRPPEGNNITYMIQLKHKKNPSNITKQEFLPGKSENTTKALKGDFFLQKYVKDMRDIKKNIEIPGSGVAEDLGPFNNIQFVLFSNRGVYPQNFLQKANSMMSSLVNTKIVDVYKFDFDELSKLDNFFSDSCRNLFLFPNQMSAKQVADEIELEIKKIFAWLDVTEIYAKSIANDFIKYIASWAKGDFGKHYYLTKQEVLCKLCELYFRQFEINLDKELFTFYDSGRKLIWNDIVRDKDLILIDADDLTSQFLFDFIGSEVKNVCKGTFNYWTDDLSQKNKNIVRQTVNEEFNCQLLKVVGKQGKLNALDIYRTMYMIKQIPLILVVSKTKQYENILRVLTFSGYHFKIIILNKSGNILKESGNGKSFWTLHELPHELKMKIMDIPVKLQGKQVLLRNLVNDEICKLIKCRDVINILLGNFNIGKEFPSLPIYFVERSISKVLIEFDILLNNIDEILLIENPTENKLSITPIKNQNVFKCDDIDFQNSRGAFIVKGLENATREQKEKLRFTGKKIHYLIIHDLHCFEWKWSLGSINNLIPFRINTFEIFNDSFEDNFNNDVNIIGAPPGMGKTTLMDCLAHRAPANKWVIRIDLNIPDNRKYYKNKFNSDNNSLEHLRFFNRHQIKENGSELAQEIFEKLLYEKNLIILLDGFDEVSYSFKVEVTDIAKSFRLDGFLIWITSRPHMKSYLENEFNVFSLNFKPFDLKDQIHFLKQYFTILNDDLNFSPNLLEGFVNKLIEAAKRNLNDRDAEFTGIPLQSKLLAEVFNDHCKKYLKSSGESKFEENFNLLDLYQKLVDKKIDILCEKFGPGTGNTHSKFIKHHQSLLAYKLLFPTKCLEGSYVQEQLRDFISNGEKKDLELLQMDGIMTIDEKDNVNCVHQTFAEYLLAQFVADNLNNKKSGVEEIVRFVYTRRLFEWHPFLFETLDSILIKDCSLPLQSLHLAIRKKDLTTIDDIINTNPNIISDVDKCGRSVVHMLALYSTPFPLQFDSKYVTDAKFKSHVMIKIIEKIPNLTMQRVKNDVLGYSPLDYAISNGFLYAAKLISDKSNLFKTNLIFTIDEFRHHLKYCIELNCKSLYKIILGCFVSRLVLNSRHEISTKLEKLIDEDCITKYNECVCSQEQISPDMTCLELIRSDIGNPYAGYHDNSYFDLYFAAAFNYMDLVNNLHKLGINATDFEHHTLLYYAVQHGHCNTVNYLLLDRANANVQDFDGNTPLLVAVANYNKCFNSSTGIISDIMATRYYTIIKILIDYKANSNTQNIYGATCLHNILDTSYSKFLLARFTNETEGRHLDIVRRLISNGADINISDESGCTPLQEAVQSMLDDCVTYLLDEGADVNKINIQGNSIIHTLINVEFRDMVPDQRSFNEHKENMLRKLIKRIANVNHQNNNGETALHCVVRKAKFLNSRVTTKVLLDHGADVNIQNYRGDKPLHLAVLYLDLLLVDSISLYELLLSKDNDVNLQNNDGNTPLHLIFESKLFKNYCANKSILVKKFLYDIAIPLLEKGANINIQNKNGKSVLKLAQELAYDEDHCEMICILDCFIAVRQLSSLVLQ